MPSPVVLYHFTHVDHLPSIVAGGLICDSAVGQRLTSEAGEPASSGVGAT